METLRLKCRRLSFFVRAVLVEARPHWQVCTDVDSEELKKVRHPLLTRKTNINYPLSVEPTQCSALYQGKIQDSCQVLHRPRALCSVAVFLVKRWSLSFVPLFFKVQNRMLVLKRQITQRAENKCLLIRKQRNDVHIFGGDGARQWRKRLYTKTMKKGETTFVSCMDLANRTSECM